MMCTVKPFPDCQGRLLRFAIRKGLYLNAMNPILPIRMEQNIVICAASEALSHFQSRLPGLLAMRIVFNHANRPAPLARASGVG